MLSHAREHIASDGWAICHARPQAQAISARGLHAQLALNSLLGKTGQD